MHSGVQVALKEQEHGPRPGDISHPDIETECVWVDRWLGSPQDMM